MQTLTTETLHYKALLLITCARLITQSSDPQWAKLMKNLNVCQVILCLLHIFIIKKLLFSFNSQHCWYFQHQLHRHSSLVLILYPIPDWGFLWGQRNLKKNCATSSTCILDIYAKQRRSDKQGHCGKAAAWYKHERRHQSHTPWLKFEENAGRWTRLCEVFNKPDCTNFTERNHLLFDTFC